MSENGPRFNPEQNLDFNKIDNGEPKKELREFDFSGSTQDLLKKLIVESGITEDYESFEKKFLLQVTPGARKKVNIDDIKVTPFEKRGAGYVFYAKVNYQSKSKKTLQKCEMTVSQIISGIGENKTTKLVPKWFVISISKYVQ